MEELLKPYTCTKLAQNVNCSTMTEVAFTPAETSKFTETAKALAEKAKAPAEKAKAPAEKAKAPAEKAKAPAEKAKDPAEKAKAPKTVEVLNISKLKVPAPHPDFSEMIHAAIAALKEHNGSS
jgi:hypothetical protein